MKRKAFESLRVNGLCKCYYINCESVTIKIMFLFCCFFLPNFCSFPPKLPYRWSLTLPLTLLLYVFHFQYISPFLFFLPFFLIVSVSFLSLSILLPFTLSNSSLSFSISHSLTHSSSSISLDHHTLFFSSCFSVSPRHYSFSVRFRTESFRQMLTKKLAHSALFSTRY